MENNILKLHVIPKSSRNEIIGWVMDAAGSESLKVKLNAAPEDGKANKALLKFLAKEWDVPAASLELVSGETSRHKRLRFESNDLYRQIIQAYR